MKADRHLPPPPNACVRLRPLRHLYIGIAFGVWPSLSFPAAELPPGPYFFDADKRSLFSSCRQIQQGLGTKPCLSSISFATPYAPYYKERSGVVENLGSKKGDIFRLPNSCPRLSEITLHCPSYPDVAPLHPAIKSRPFAAPPMMCGHPTPTVLALAAAEGGRRLKQVECVVSRLLIAAKDGCPLSLPPFKAAPLLSSDDGSSSPSMFGVVVSRWILRGASSLSRRLSVQL